MASMTSLAPARATTAEFAVEIRRSIIEMSGSEHGVHLGGALSVADLLAVLYREVLRDPLGTAGPRDRDYLVLSKGHASAALYSALAGIGAISRDECATYAEPGGRLAGHPMRRLPGVDFSTGSLGHGLSLGLGVALAGLRFGLGTRCFVVLGDGELQEGSNWEAVMAASHLRVDNLFAVVDRNGWQCGGPTEGSLGLEPLAAKWSSFGWHVRIIDGHDHELIREAFLAPPIPGRPTVVLAETIKGRGIAGLENTKHSHSATLDRRSQELAIEALENEPW
jgi:transketolase